MFCEKLHKNIGKFSLFHTKIIKLNISYLQMENLCYTVVTSNSSHENDLFKTVSFVDQMLSELPKQIRVTVSKPFRQMNPEKCKLWCISVSGESFRNCLIGGMSLIE